MTSPPLKGLMARREFHGLTQKEMGDLIGTSQSQYNKFEKGLVRLDVQRAKVLADRLECEIGDLL